jgi:hypothetical protein
MRIFTEGNSTPDFFTEAVLWVVNCFFMEVIHTVWGSGFIRQG